ncbi:hybrid sensor histidine kinase/response regulator [Microvirga mediterraneensis]|uniref:histidine kinase n=1 Tax=Microvirga mediterraneensis TaxID=2754695 RepID=A0A838BM67_9HYPH|nr:hybrid sensor histidine kinase/response regulator [Microvirga mediterraneensis]MBA1156540.1 response regulator [Microvirga mediterraneensis]
MPRKAAIGWLHHRSLVWRFLLIGVAALAPLVAALVQFAGNERDWAIRVTHERAEFFASYAVTNQRKIVDDAQVVLSVIADMPEVRAGGSACDAILSRHVTIHQWATSLQLSDLTGNVICADTPAIKNADLSGRESYKRAIQERAFALGDLGTDQKTGTLTMTAAFPIIHDGQVTGILSLEIASNLFLGASAQDGFPADISMFLIDQDGMLLMHYPPMGDLIGTSIGNRPAAQRAIAQPQGVNEVPDLSGKLRLFVFRPLPYTNAVLALGINHNSVIGEINGVLRFRLSLITLIIGGSIILGILGAELLILRPLRDLIYTARALEHGDFTVVYPEGGAGEVRLLGRVLNRMGKVVSDREHELMAAKNIAERALDEARLANNAKTDFLATMSHEFRTPLNGIIGYTERLLDGDLDVQQRRYAELIQISASALLTVANDVLDLSSIEADQIVLQQEPFSLIALIDNTVSIVSSIIEKKEVELRTEWDSDIPSILVGDETRLRQILLNLLNNAVKFTREGQITVRAQYKGSSPQGESLQISVIDTGIGIPSEKRDRLFKRFSQIDHSISREFGGTGLGLAISKRLVELMGGEIGVESEEGRGSIFWIELSLPRGEYTLAPQNLIANTPKAKPSRILLAEDIEVNQELAKFLIEAEGHEVDIAWNGSEAIEAVRRKTYDLVLMDVQMPGMDGLAATQAIRALPPPLSSVPIIAMTANVLPQQVRQFKRAGMDDHIGKPMKREDLLRKLGEWLPVSEQPETIQDKPLATTTASIASSGFDEKSFLEFRSMMGPERVGLWLARLDEQLQVLIAKESKSLDREQLAKQAHSLISQAALLGFSDLARKCTELEQACNNGVRLSGPLKSACQAANEVRAVLMRIG